VLKKKYSWFAKNPYRKKGLSVEGPFRFFKIIKKEWGWIKRSCENEWMAPEIKWDHFA
jgi:hypothetical protein